MDETWLCRDFTARLVRLDDSILLEVTGEVLGPFGVERVSLRVHEAQGFNELDLLVGIVAEGAPSGSGAAGTWVPVRFALPTRTRYSTVTITDCGATITVADESAPA
jgi:hypothetical protein